MGKTYLSWDVGITNLAYCLIECQDDKSAKFKIKKWGIINLGEEPPSCIEKDRTGSQCKYKAIYCALINNKQIYYCKTHSKKYVQEQILEIQCDNTDKCEHMINNHKAGTVHTCDKKAQSCIEVNKKNTAYCKTHLNVHMKQMDKDRSLKKVKKINANKIPIETLAIKLLEILDSIMEFKNVDEVLIENQPSLKNPTMKTISSVLFSYFVLKGMVEKHNISNVQFISPSNKLKVGSEANKKLKNMKKKGDNDRKVYAQTKKMGTEFCKELIKDDIQNTEFLNKQKKKDDLADSFLQGYYYIFCKNGVPKNMQDILNQLVLKDDNNDEKGIDLTNLIIE